MNVENKILELRKSLHRHNHLYYMLDNPEISDFEYDQMLKNLEELERKYLNDEKYAKDNKLGMWKGSFMRPEKWRKLN